MQTRLVRYGHEWAVVIDTSILEALDLHEQALVDVRVESGKTVITVLESRQERDRKFEEALEEVNRKRASMLRRLADS